MTDGIGSYAETGRRRLILCCDGTWNSADAGGSATNVVRLTRVLKAQSAEGIPQIVYYHDGVGTGNLLDKISGGAGGIGISRNIRRIYSFIVNNYATPPDGDRKSTRLNSSH